MPEPVSMKCKTCGERSIVEVPDALKDMVEVLEFYCGKCGPPK